MPTTFLNISLSLESDLPLDQLYNDLSDRLEYLLSEDNAKVFSITWDRAQAIAFVQAQTVQTVEENCPLAPTVAAVLARFSFALPKEKKGAPRWRVPKGECWGEVEGLPSLRGKVVLTNGIIAFLVRQDGHWTNIHWDWFLVDKEETLPEGVENPKGRGLAKKDSKLEAAFADF